jgi:hypothetical protein
MMIALRTLAATLAGLLAAFVLVVAVEVLSNAVHPYPEGFENTPEAMHEHVKRIPPWVLALAVLLWGATALAATWIAGKFGNLVSFAIVGLLLVLGLVFNISLLPYPMWFKIGTLLVIPAAIAAAGRLSMRHKTAPIGA